MLKKALLFSFFIFALSSVSYASGGEASHDEGFNLSEIIAHHLGDHANFPFNIGGEKVYEDQPDFNSDKKAHLDEGTIFIDHSNHKKYRFISGVSLHITKRVTMMWIAVFLMLITFITAARKIAANPYRVHSRFTGVVESFINYLRHEVIDPNMHHHGEHFYSYLFTLFFFILFCNLLGLIPSLGEIVDTTRGVHDGLPTKIWSGITVTGDISVTLSLALLTFILIFGTGFIYQNVMYVRNVVPNGVPYWLYPLLWPLEFLVSPLSKCFALTVRLLANMTAGHVVILALLGFIFQYKSAPAIVGSVFGSVAMYFLELLVSFLQAYIFTLLTSLFVGSAMHRH